MRHVAVPNVHCGLEPSRERAESRAQHDGDIRYSGQPAPHDGPGFGDGVEIGGHAAARPYSRKPAIVAVRKFASVPAIIARNPSRARS